MTGLTEYLGRPFEMLDEYTADEVDQHGVYAETRTGGGLYSITSTQSEEYVRRVRVGAR